MAELLPASLGGLSNPATMLVEKVSNALGRHFDPRQTVRMAEAEAKAGRIRAISEAETDIEVAELRRRAAERFIYEEMKKQSNMEDITQKAIPHLTDNAEPEKIEDDWIVNFFEKCRITSDDQMKDLWARILAGQGNNPGSFSRKTVNLVADLEKRDATIFANLCRFGWLLNNSFQPLVLDDQHEIYNKHGINFDTLTHLESLGLIRFDGLSGFRFMNLPKSITVSYGKRQTILTLPNDSGNDLSIGNILLTQAGGELTRIVVPGLSPVEGFFDYVYDKWADQSFVPPRH